MTKGCCGWVAVMIVLLRWVGGGGGAMVIIGVRAQPPYMHMFVNFYIISS